MRSVKGIAFLQVWLMVFGIFGFSFVMGAVGVDDGFNILLDDGSSLLVTTTGGGFESTDALGRTIFKEIPRNNLVGSGGPAITNAPTGTTLWSGAPIFESGSTLAPGTYASGTVGGHALVNGQTAVVSKVGTGYSTVINDAAGKAIGDPILSDTVIAGSEVVSSAGAPGSTLSGWLGAGGGSGPDALLTGVWYAAIAYGAGILIGGLLGFSDDNSKALGTSLAAGVGAYNALSTWSATANTWLASGWVGFGIGAAVFLATYKETETVDVTFDCMPWQAPSGGNACEVCNGDDLPCSEYRCNSLGQSCKIVNEGSIEERCVYVNPRDITPPVINPNYEMLSIGYQYDNVRSSPPGPGFEIVNSDSSDGCLKAFTSLEFGITTDEPAQCKIDFNYTDNFDSMIAYVGGNNFYSYNHSETFSLPGAEILMGAGFALENGRDMEFYLRCKDKNGNENSAAYAVDFCVDPTPDTTAPVVEATSILNGECVGENTNSADVVFYVNEPSECKWSFQDQDFDLMENNMRCSSSYDQVNAAQLFGCTASLTGIPRDGTRYYVRCKDQPSVAEEDRNANTESFEFNLRGSNSLVLKNIEPNGTVFGGVSPANVELYGETFSGCNEGLAICEWSLDDDPHYFRFFDTNNEDGIHTQALPLNDGEHDIRVRCVDAGGNVAEDVVSFNVDIDLNPPVVARVYEEAGMLKIVTVRDSECSYSLDNCDFTFTQGVEMPNANTPVHVVEWGEDNTYYIKCRDEFLNEGTGCSVVVRPTENFL